MRKSLIRVTIALLFLLFFIFSPVKTNATTYVITVQSNFFNPSTKINYEMPFDGTMKLVVFDNLGREVKTLVNGNVSAGYYKVEFNGAGLTSGIYFYRVDAASGSQIYSKVFKMVLVK